MSLTFQKHTDGSVTILSDWEPETEITLDLLGRSPFIRYDPLDKQLDIKVSNGRGIYKVTKRSTDRLTGKLVYSE